MANSLNFSGNITATGMNISSGGNNTPVMSTKYITATKLTLSSSGWSASGDYYVQTISNLTIHDSHPMWTPCDSAGTGIPTSDDAMLLMYAVAGANSLTFYAYSEPSDDLYVLVKGVE